MRVRAAFLALALVLGAGAADRAFPAGEFFETTEELGLGVEASSDQGPGCGFADIDSDGDLDIMVVDGLGDPNVVFIQDGVRSFVESASSIGLDDDGWGKSVTFADYDNDGDPDLLLTRLGQSNVLCRNDGGIFTDVSVEAGFDFFNQNSGAAWADYDLDGYLDVYITTYNSSANKLMHNLGDGTFEEVAVAAGVADETGYGFQPAWLDYDNDGDSDLYVSNDVFGTPNALFRNNGDGTFTDVSVASGAGIDMSAMGIAVGDYNNNGLLDLYVANISTGNVLLANDGDGTFTERASEEGVEAGVISWGVNFFDFDHDGRLDLYCNVSSDDYLAPPPEDRKRVEDLELMPSPPGLGSPESDSQQPPTLQARLRDRAARGSAYPNILFQNTGNGFINISAGSGIDDGGRSFSSAVGDYDNDGDLDLYVTNWFVVQTDSLTSMFENNHIPRSGSATDWLRVRLVGTASNRDGVGARVWIETADGWQVRERAIGTSYLACSDPYLHFGTGSSSTISRLYVRWPSGLGEVYEAVSTGQILTLTEGNGTVAEVPRIGKNGVAEAALRIVPNPSSGRTRIELAREVAPARIWIVDAGGRRVWSKSASEWGPADREIRWDGRDVRGHDLPSGTYFVHMETAAGRVHSRAALIVR